MKHGAVLSSADVSSASLVRAGAVTMVAEATKAVTFSSPLPDANYRVMLTLEGLAGVAMAAQSKTASGFTVLAASPATGTVAYVAVQDT